MSQCTASRNGGRGVESHPPTHTPRGEGSERREEGRRRVRSGKVRVREGGRRGREKDQGK